MSEKSNPDVPEIIESDSISPVAPISKNPKAKTSRPVKSFPNNTIEDSLKIPSAIAKYNAGNPWSGTQLANALSAGEKSSTFYYLTVSSRDYGFTTGTSRTTVELTPLGRTVVFPQDPHKEYIAIQQAFLNIDLFKKVFEYYNGNAGSLPEERFVSNVLQEKFGLDRSYHKEFIETYQVNMSFLKSKPGIMPNVQNVATVTQQKTTEDTTNVDIPNGKDDLFVIIPFNEKTETYPNGYFAEVYSSLIVPAAAQAGYTVQTANRNGSDIIHKTIVSSIYSAKLILADLTEHNPNVLFELGLAIAFRKKVALIRAKGTNPIFDVDNSMRVLDYDSKLWKSTVRLAVLSNISTI